MLNRLVVIVRSGKVHLVLYMLVCFLLLIFLVLACEPLFLGLGFHIESKKLSENTITYLNSFSIIF